MVSMPANAFSGGAFWEQKSVFLTGATGFVGKAVVEKLLSGRVGIPRQIFVLVRKTETLSAEARIEAAISSPVFDKLRSELGKKALLELAKVVIMPVTGDLIEHQLGMDPQIRKQIVEECDVTINCAATIKFDEPLHVARSINTIGALRVLELASECHQRVSGGFHTHVQVSTSFVNANLPSGVVEEKIYPAAFDPELYLQLSDHALTERLTTLPGGYPNTYTFSKAMTETIAAQSVNDSNHALFGTPLVIVRPSIIAAAWLDPMPGWIEHASPLAAVGADIALGHMTIWPQDPNMYIDAVPLDTVVDGILASVVCFETLPVQNGSVPIVQLASSGVNPVTAQEVWQELIDLFAEHPSSKQERQVNLVFSDLKAAGMDMKRRSLMAAALLTANQKKAGTRLQRVVRTTTKMYELYGQFFGKRWIFQGETVKLLPSLLEKQGEIQRDYRALAISEINWSSYFQAMWRGLKIFIFKEACPEINIVVQDRCEGLESVCSEALLLSSHRGLVSFQSRL